MLAAAVVVVPSRWYENQPMVVLEALARGVPVVGSALGGMPELIEPGATGDLVPANDPHALAAALAPYLRRPAARFLDARPSTGNDRLGVLAGAASRAHRRGVRARRQRRPPLRARRMRPAAHRLHRAARCSGHDWRYRAPRRGDRLAARRPRSRGHRVHAGQLHEQPHLASTAACACATSPPRRPSISRHSCTAASRPAVAMLPGADRSGHPALPRDRTVRLHAAPASADAPRGRARPSTASTTTATSGVSAREPRCESRAGSAHTCRTPRSPSRKTWPTSTCTRYGRVAHYIPNGVAAPVRRAAAAHHRALRAAGRGLRALSRPARAGEGAGSAGPCLPQPGHDGHAS